MSEHVLQACRATAVSNSEHEVNILISQLQTLQPKKSWTGSRIEAIGYKHVWLSGLTELEQLHLELNIECIQHLYISAPHSNSQYTHKHYGHAPQMHTAQDTIGFIHLLRSTL